MSSTPPLPGSQFARSFGSQAEEYDRMRPPYPAEAVGFVLHGRPPGRVLDLGAGTGKLTAALLDRAEQVLAVEPDAQMRAVLATAVPGAEVLAGSAEEIPVPDSSLDAVLAGQAFHWFARPHADHELARVLRPGGVVGLLWNFPDGDVQWVRAMYQATHDREVPWSWTYEALDAALFSPPETAWTSWIYRLPGPDAVVRLAHTWSWVITRPPAEQREIEQRLRRLAEQYPQLRGPALELPMRTRAVRQYLR